LYVANETSAIDGINTVFDLVSVRLRKRTEQLLARGRDLCARHRNPGGQPRAQPHTSRFTGAVSGEIFNVRGDIVSSKLGTVSVMIDDTSTWTLEADTYVNSFIGDSASVIRNGYTLYVDGVALPETE